MNRARSALNRSSYESRERRDMQAYIYHTRIKLKNMGLTDAQISPNIKGLSGADLESALTPMVTALDCKITKVEGRKVTVRAPRAPLSISKEMIALTVMFLTGSDDQTATPVNNYSIQINL